MTWVSIDTLLATWLPGVVKRILEACGKVVQFSAKLPEGAPILLNVRIRVQIRLRQSKGDAAGHVQNTLPAGVAPS